MKFFKRKIALVLFVIGSLQTTAAQTFIQRYADVSNQASQANITNNLIQYEALGVKQKGTSALQNTLDWLKNKYLSYGYAAGQMVEDSYSYSGVTCKNLVLTKVGTVYPNTYVIICGHYDSITGTGTNDNGSGTVVLLEVARLLQSIPTEYSIKFINFSGEEDGLYGSQHYVSSVVNGTTPKMDIKLVFNIDEVGGVAGMVNNTVTCERDTGSPTSNNAASNTITSELIMCVGLYSPLNTFLNYAYASDYMPFENNDEVITGFFEKNESSHRHTTTDLLVNMDPLYVYNISKAAAGAMMHFAKAGTTLSTNEYNADFQISFFPNPTKGKLNINLGTLPKNNYTFSLTDIQGKEVYKDSILDAKQIETIDVSHFSKGVYLGVLETDQKRIARKIVIE
ncbi:MULTISPECIES: M28 family peptidase [Flavobacterium]|uniref:M28 family peptidase n=1 Tax=Flavobacterium TaxID=237 RepID=UPI001FCA6D84|nr:MULTISPECIES: M28 family peptidase [Flavobacterium]UOK41324.1 M28 family peptidase [Flavobacterium enshiense]